MVKIELLDQIEENVEFADELKILREAISDWDGEIVTVEDYIDQLREFLGGSLEYEKTKVIEIITTKNALRFSWKVESASTILKLLDVKNTMEVKTLSSVLHGLLIFLKEYLIVP